MEMTLSKLMHLHTPMLRTAMERREQHTTLWIAAMVLDILTALQQVGDPEEDCCAGQDDESYDTVRMSAPIFYSNSLLRYCAFSFLFCEYR